MIEESTSGVKKRSVPNSGPIGVRPELWGRLPDKLEEGAAMNPPIA